MWENKEEMEKDGFLSFSSFSKRQKSDLYASSLFFERKWICLLSVEGSLIRFHYIIILQNYFFQIRYILFRIHFSKLIAHVAHSWQGFRNVKAIYQWGAQKLRIFWLRKTRKKIKNRIGNCYSGRIRPFFPYRAVSLFRSVFFPFPQTMFSQKIRFGGISFFALERRKRISGK